MAQASRIFAIALFGIAGLLGLYAFTLTRAAPVPVASAARAQIADASVAVIVAAHELAPGHALVAEDLSIAMQPAMPAGGFNSVSGLIGKTPAAHIPAGAALTDGVLGTGLSAAIEPGERAVSIRVDESNAVSNLVKPGDTVDVFLVLKRDAAVDGEIPTSHARLLLSKVRVLGFGDNVISNADSAKAPSQASAARTAVLSVPVEDIDALSLAENSGHLLLALRNPVDANSAKVARAAAGVTMAALNGTNAVAAPVRTARATPMLPPLPATLASPKLAGGIEVIRGSRSESVSNP